VLLEISRLGQAGGSEKGAVVAMQGRGRELLRNAGEIQNGSAVVEKAEEGMREWIRMGWVSFFYISPKPNRLIGSVFEIRITPDGGWGAYAGRS
jgi:hypothetical protein